MKEIDENFFNKKNKIKPTETESIIGDNEKILWKGKPKKGVYAFETAFKKSPFGVFFPIAIFIVGSLFTKSLFSADSTFHYLFFILLLGGYTIVSFILFMHTLIKAIVDMRNTEYCITDKRIIERRGKYKLVLCCIPLNSISNVELKTSFVDNMFHAGDIYIDGGKNGTVVLFDIPNCEYIKTRIEKLKNNAPDNCRVLFYADNYICEHCGSYYSASMNACPSCGAPRTTNTKTSKKK